MHKKKLLCIVGMSSYWCWTLLDRSNLMQFGGFISGVDASILTGVTLLVVLGITFFIGHNSSIQMLLRLKICLAFMAVVAVVFLIIAMYFRHSYFLHGLSSIALATLRSGLMVIWTLQLVTFGKKDFVKQLIVCTTVTVIIFLLTLALPAIFATALYFLMILLSGVLVIAIESPDYTEKAGIASKDHEPLPMKDYFLFYLIRFELGVAVGLTAALLSTHEITSLNCGQQALSLVASLLLSIGILPLKNGKNFQFIVLLAPLILSVFMIIPAVIKPEMLLQMSVSCIWFSITYISVVHIFVNKKMGLVKLPLIVASAQLVSSFGTFLSNSISSLQLFQHIVEIPVLYRVLFSLALFYALLIVAVYILARLVAPDNREKDTEQVIKAVSNLAVEYSLTNREKEILELLAAGYSRPYISEKLILAPSTVKTHVNHLYKKIGINKKDDLLDLIEYAKKVSK